MRNQWRFLLRFNRNHSFQTPTTISKRLTFHQVPSNPSFSPHLTSFTPFFTPTFVHHFSSITENSTDPLTLISIFTKPINGDDINKELTSINAIFTPNLVTSVLKNLNDDPKTAIKFFYWVFKRENKSLTCKGYNFMLGVLGSNGLFKEFWGLYDLMVKRGLGVRKGTYDKVLEKFEKEGSEFDVEKLKNLYSKDVNGKIEFGCSRVSNIIKRNVWDESVEEELKGLGVNYTSELITMVLEKLDEEPMKGLMFFRWVEESGLFRHDQGTYNAMAVALGGGDCLDRFWNLVDEMKNVGCELEMKTCCKVLRRFIENNMVEDVVRLYEYMMNGANEPSRLVGIVLRKIVISKEFDIELFSRVVKKISECGSDLDDSMLKSVLKSLKSVRRIDIYVKVLDAMVQCGYKPSEPLLCRVAFDASRTRMKDEAREFIDKTREYFEIMLKREGSSSTKMYDFELLVNAYCNTGRAAEVCKIVYDLVDKEDIKPRHDTYKTLTRKLLAQKEFQEAINLIGLMKKHGFPPFLSPFIGYFKKIGTVDEAMLFFKAITVKDIPSVDVFFRVFRAFLRAGKHEQAHNLLAKCPQRIQNHAVILDLFYSMKPETEPIAVAAA